MKLLSEASEDVLREARGVIFDVDDTVTANGRLQLDAFTAMWRAKAAGLKLVAITGRPLGWVDVIARHWPVDMAIGENGAGWAWIKDGRFFTGYYEKDPTRLSHERLLLSIKEAMARDFPNVELANDSLARRCDLAFDAFEEAQLDEETVKNAVALIREHNAESFVSSVHIHAVPGSWNKATGALRALREVLNEDLVQNNTAWWFVGDSGNDEAAFSFFENSVGVANIAEHLSRIATPPRYVTRSERAQGYAELLERLIAAKF